MKIHREGKGSDFTPVTISVTIETQEEASALMAFKESVGASDFDMCMSDDYGHPYTLAKTIQDMVDNIAGEL